jgi:hypothetical protein
VVCAGEGHTQLPLLLDVVQREDDLLPGDLAVHAATAEQQLNTVSPGCNQLAWQLSAGQQGGAVSPAQQACMLVDRTGCLELS